ncbi:MAG: LysE family transporter, partial [Deltaproteobacteria bacterium]|nr:LysE family transporter [Deltaproteobacteria bacterium]
MSSILFMAVVLGVIGGITPGPLLILVVSETLKYGTREGIRVALVPAITDLPIVMASVYLVSILSNFSVCLGTVALAGGIFLCYLGYKSMIF